MSEWKNRYVVVKNADAEGDPIPDDEPVLVIRAQDQLAVEAMDWYLGRYEVQQGATAEVRDRLLAHRAELVRWRNENSDRIKVAD